LGRLETAGRRRANGPSRRNLAVAARSGEGPLTILIADLRHCVVQTGGLLSSRPKRWQPPDGELDRSIGIGRNEIGAQDD